MQSDLTNTLVDRSSDSVANKTNPFKPNPNQGILAVRKSINEKKINGFEKKYGKIFSLSEKEKDIFENVYIKEIEKRL